jgi:hypothetical protein
MADGNWLTNLFSSPNAIAPAPRGVGPQGQDFISSFKESAAPVLQDVGEATGKLFQDPNFLKFLADTGTELDPHGAGGAIGRPTSSMIERQQIGEALSQQDKVGNVQLEKLLEYLTGSSNLTGIKIGQDGTLELKGAAGEQGAGESKESELKGKSVFDQGQGGEPEDSLSHIEKALDDIMFSFSIGG